MYIRLVLFCFVLRSLTLFSQDEGIKKQEYRSPLDIPLVLAANFGELRPNHFHMGVDFKTNGKEGYKIYSIDDGFVSRIKISVGGYGKAIYVAHPNGVTSVYAHCSGFPTRIDSLIYAHQQREQHYEVEIFLTSQTLPVKRGEVIAISGNTGGSTAPHLHFELRNTESGQAMNPLVYGFEVADTKPPVIRGLKVYSVDENGFMVPGKSKQVSIQKVNDKKYATNGTVSVPAHFCSEEGGIGLAFDLVDYFDAAPNVCGLYASRLELNGNLIHGQQIDEIYFEDSRYINSHKDHAAYLKGQHYHKNFRNIHNPLGIYTTESDGILKLNPGEKRQIQFTAWDTKKNTSGLQFELAVEPGEKAKGPLFDPKLYYLPEEPIRLSSNSFSVEMQACSLYEPLKKSEIDLQRMRVGNPDTPVELAFSVQIKKTNLTLPQEKYYIQVITGAGKRKALKTRYNNDHFIAESKFMGTFSLQVDTIPPTISSLNFTPTLTLNSKQQLTWKILEKETDLIDYDLYIDGEWQLLEYEYKGDKLIFNPRTSLKGQKGFILTARDSCGNISIWENTLTFL